MGILDSIVEWIATQIMNLLDLVTGSVLGALGCDMSTFLRYFPAAETLYEVFAAIAVGFILLNLVWQLFKNFGLGVGLSAEDPTKLAIKSILFIFLALFADQIMVLILGIAGTPYDWVVDTALPPIEFSNFGSVLTVIVGCLASGSVSLNHDFLPRINRAEEFVELFESSIEHMSETRVEKDEVRKQFRIRGWSEETRQVILAALEYYKCAEGLAKIRG